jgi:hypothetical protein
MDRVAVRYGGRATKARVAVWAASQRWESSCDACGQRWASDGARYGGKSVGGGGRAQQHVRACFASHSFVHCRNEPWSSGPPPCCVPLAACEREVCGQRCKRAGVASGLPACGHRAPTLHRYGIPIRRYRDTTFSKNKDTPIRQVYKYIEKKIII